MAGRPRYDVLCDCRPMKQTHSREFACIVATKRGAERDRDSKGVEGRMTPSPADKGVCILSQAIPQEENTSDGASNLRWGSRPQPPMVVRACDESQQTPVSAMFDIVKECVQLHYKLAYKPVVVWSTAVDQ